jgi:hypothetical protein
VKRYKSTTILGGGPPGKIVQCQSFRKNKFIIVTLENLLFNVKKLFLKNILSFIYNIKYNTSD